MKKDSAKSAKRIFAILFFVLILCSFQSFSQKANEYSHPKFRNSASLSSFLLLGMAQVNYERLLGSRHGLMAEGSYSFTSETWTIGAAYRFHFKKSLKGTFGYVFSRFGQVYYTVKENTDTAENEYQMETELKLIGLGIGHRWQWDSGWAIVLRGGCGIQIDPKYTWSPTEPSDKHTKDRAQNIQSLDLELSIGYSF